MIPAPIASEAVTGRQLDDLVVDVELLVVGDHLAGEDQLHDLQVADVDRLVEAPLVADVGERGRGREASGELRAPGAGSR